MKKFFRSSNGATKGAALIIVLAFVVLVTVLSVSYFSHATTDRQLAHSSYNDTSADLLARTALDIVVGNLKQEISTPSSVTQANIQPQRSGDDPSIPNLIRRSVRNDPILSPGISSLASAIGSGPVDPANVKRGEVTPSRWNRHYLVPLANAGSNDVDTLPIPSFTAPDWVLVTRIGPVAFSQWQNTVIDPTPTNNNYVVGRYAFAVYDEGGLLDVNVGGFPTYASLSRPTRGLRQKYPLEESEIMQVACQAPDFAPSVQNEPGNGPPISTGTPLSLGPYHTNHPATSFSANWLPHGLTINSSTGIISGVPISPGTFTIMVTAFDACGHPGSPLTLNLTITGFPSPNSTPWPVNRARKGTIAFADLTALPSNPAITTSQINKLMGWRNYATTQQPPGASFDNPSFPLASADNYAKYFLGAFIPPVFSTPFTRVPITVQNGRTDQAVLTRQELIKLQRTIGFSQSLLQYLGTFSREQNRPAPDWPQLGGALAAARWDMNNLSLVIPDSWIVYPGGHGQGHAWGIQNRTLFAQLFGLRWVPGNWGARGDRFTDRDYYGHWTYIHNLNPLPAINPDFFQIIDYAMNQANGVVDPNHIRNTFNVGAALIDQYDTDDLFDPTPGQPSPPTHGNTITIIDYDGNPLNYAYGMEGMSFDDPNNNPDRPPFAPTPPPQYVLLNRRFENVGEFGYAYNPGSTTTSKTLDFASSTSHDKPILDMFTYNTASVRAGSINLNTRNGPVLASVIRGAWLHDPGSEVLPPTPPNTLVSQGDALAAGQAIVQETTSNGPALSRADVARLAAAAAAVPNLATPDEAKQTISRALTEVGQTRTWNLMIDVIAQTGHYGPNAQNFTDFIPEGEKRYWLHIALARDRNADGSIAVLGTQLEEVSD
jgi:hypothetical protein